MWCCGNKYFRLWCVYCVLCSVRLCRTLHGTPLYCSFSKAQHKLPEDGPIGPKHVEANIEIF